MLRPPALRPGDAVSIVAPASPFPRDVFERGVARLAERYRPRFAPDIFASDRYLAGADARRLAELQAALTDPETRAVFCARGGYGAMRLLPGLKLPVGHKPLIGFSDVTALHAALQAAGRVSVHGPVVTQLGRFEPAAAAELFDLLESPSAHPRFQGNPTVPGTAEGPVVGGNLSVLTRVLGTPFMPPLDGAILFLEDVTERPYRLDRMWHHLALAGAFTRIAGLALGEFTECDETKDGSWTAREILQELARAQKVPCVMDLPMGHGKVNRPFPLGARARLDGETGTLAFTEGAVQ